MRESMWGEAREGFIAFGSSWVIGSLERGRFTGRLQFNELVGT